MRKIERGQQIGDGTPVHVTIPTTNPWVPLRILGLGKQAEERIDADVYLLTDRQPSLLPAPNDSMFLTHSKPATDSLLDDLRSDDGMDWVPQTAWLTKLSIDAAAADLTYDLAVDASGQGEPSRRAAGLEVVSEDAGLATEWALAGFAAVMLVFSLLIGAVSRGRP